MKKFVSALLIIVILFNLSACGGSQSEAAPQAPVESADADYIIGTWINYNEIYALIKSADSEASFSETVREKLSILKEYGVNTVFLHMRAFDDCFYSSDSFPVSKYCADDSGSLKYDVLKIFLKEGHAQKLKIHAWINPYRISLDNDISQLPDGYLPQRLISENADHQRIIVCDSGIYYNPASIEAQKHIIDGVREIISNYDVDGIHLDDYFYPDASAGIDSDYYNEYIKKGGYLSLGDYRRQCVNAMISSVYSAIKTEDSKIIFSISPTGSINDNVNGLFADVRLWLSESGYADYVIPQIYYGFENSKYPFESTVEAWLKLSGEGARLLVGLPLYKTGVEDRYAGAGKQEFLNNSDIIARQITYIKGKAGIKGFVYYSAGQLYSNAEEIRSKELANIKNIVKAENFNTSGA